MAMTATLSSTLLRCEYGFFIIAFITQIESGQDNQFLLCGTHTKHLNNPIQQQSADILAFVLYNCVQQ